MFKSRKSRKNHTESLSGTGLTLNPQTSSTHTPGSFRETPGHDATVVGDYNVFGMGLEEVVRLDQNYEDTDIFKKQESSSSRICDIAIERYVPKIVAKCVKFINKHGLQEEGLYRISGSSAKVKELQDRFIRGESVAAEKQSFINKEGPTFEFDYETCDVHTVASLFKHFLREIKSEVLPASNAFLSLDNSSQASNDRAFLTSIQNDAVDSDLIPTQLLQEELKKLSHCNFALLQVLSRHLNKVWKQADANLMNLTNLCVVFGPTLRIRKSLLQALIQKADVLWSGLKPSPQKPDFNNGGATTLEGEYSNHEPEGDSQYDSFIYQPEFYKMISEGAIDDDAIVQRLNDHNKIDSNPSVPKHLEMSAISSIETNKTDWEVNSMLKAASTFEENDALTRSSTDSSRTASQSVSSKHSSSNRFKGFFKR